MDNGTASGAGHVRTSYIQALVIYGSPRVIGYMAVLLDLKSGSGVPAREFAFPTRVLLEYFDRASTGRPSTKPGKYVRY